MTTEQLAQMVQKGFESMVSKNEFSEEIPKLRQEMRDGFEKVGIQIGHLANKAFEDRTEVSTLARRVEKFDARLRALEKHRA